MNESINYVMYKFNNNNHGIMTATILSNKRKTNTLQSK